MSQRKMNVISRKADKRGKGRLKKAFAEFVHTVSGVYEAIVLEILEIEYWLEYIELIVNTHTPCFGLFPINTHLLLDGQYP